MTTHAPPNPRLCCSASSAPFTWRSPAERISDEPIDARVTIAPSALATNGDLPVAGSPDHEVLRGYLVRELNRIVGGGPAGTRLLPTTAQLAHRTGAGAVHGEVLRVVLETRLPSGPSVKTDLEVTWSPPAEPDGRGPAAAAAAWVLWPLLGAAGPSASIPVALGWAILAGPPETSSRLVAISLVGAAVIGLAAGGVALLLASVQATRLESARTTAFSDGLQRAMRFHAMALVEGLRGRSPDARSRPAVAEPRPRARRRRAPPWPPGTRTTPRAA